MQKFSEFVQIRNLAEAIVDSGCDVEALCEGLVGIAQQKRLSEEVVLEAWYGKEVYNELFGIGRGIAAAARGVGAGLGLGGKVAGDVGRAGLAGVDAVGQGAIDAGAAAGRGVAAGGRAIGGGLGWLGKKAMAGASAVGGAAAGAGRAVGGAAAGAGRAVGGYAKNAMDAGRRAEAVRQVNDRIKLLNGALGALGYGPQEVQQILAPLAQAVADAQAG